jgi:hypothetical protein
VWPGVATLRKVYVVNFAKVKSPQGNTTGYGDLRCGEIDMKLWWTCGGLVVDLWRTCGGLVAHL